MGITILSINIEGSKHLEVVEMMIKKTEADVVFLMETPEDQISRLAGETYPYIRFMQNDIIGNIRGLSGDIPTGVAVLSRYPLGKVWEYSCGLPPITEIKPEGTSHMPAVLVVEVVTGEGSYILGGVHYTWTKGGEATPLQQEHVKGLLEFGGTLQPHVIVGDFNIPRGNNASYRLLTSAYKDNMPKEIKTTLDPDLHYANFETRGKLAFVVDYVLSMPGYVVSGVEVITGVSDHCAVVGRVKKI